MVRSFRRCSYSAECRAQLSSRRYWWCATSSTRDKPKVRRRERVDEQLCRLASPSLSLARTRSELSTTAKNWTAALPAAAAAEAGQRLAAAFVHAPLDAHSFVFFSVERVDPEQSRVATTRSDPDRRREPFCRRQRRESYVAARTAAATICTGSSCTVHSARVEPANTDTTTTTILLDSFLLNFLMPFTFDPCTAMLAQSHKACLLSTSEKE